MWLTLSSFSFKNHTYFGHRALDFFQAKGQQFPGLQGTLHPGAWRLQVPAWKRKMRIQSWTLPAKYLKKASHLWEHSSEESNHLMYYVGKDCKVILCLWQTFHTVCRSALWLAWGFPLRCPPEYAGRPHTCWLGWEEWGCHRYSKGCGGEKQH